MCPLRKRFPWFLVQLFLITLFPTCIKLNYGEAGLGLNDRSFFNFLFLLPLQKHAYSNILKNSDIFRISAQNIDCGTR